MRDPVELSLVPDAAEIQGHGQQLDRVWIGGKRRLDLDQRQASQIGLVDPEREAANHEAGRRPETVIKRPGLRRGVQVPNDAFQIAALRRPRVPHFCRHRTSSVDQRSAETDGPRRVPQRIP